MMITSRRPHRLAAVVAATAMTVVGVSSCSSSSSGGSSSSKRIRLVAYSVPKPAYDALGAAFAKTSAGKGTKLDGSYGPSGAQSKAVIAGQKADFVNFSVEPDMTKLVPGKVDAAWNSGATKGIVTDSVVVLVVRKGNPKHITGWNDLVKPGISIVTPDPASSGSAKWNLLAAYSQVISQGGTADDAKAYLTKFFQHVKSKASSGSVAMTQFTSGAGDVLVSYEDEAIGAKAKGASIDYIIAKQSILIENPAAVTTSAPQAAKDFLAYAESDKGQQIFAAHGFRPVLSGTKIPTVPGANDPSNPFPKVQQLTTVEQLGGWKVVNDKFFGDKTGIVTQIEAGS